MRRALTFLAVLAFASLSFTKPAWSADSSEKPGRKVHKVAPVYPDIAKKLHLRGTVRVEVTIAQTGAISRTRVLGGNPLLSQAAQEAIAKWKYDAGPQETTVIEFVFAPDN